MEILHHLPCAVDLCLGTHHKDVVATSESQVRGRPTHITTHLAHTMATLAQECTHKPRRSSVAAYPDARFNHRV